MKRSRIIYLTLFILLLSVFALYKQSQTTTVMLIRHAERFDDSENTNLSDAGFARAQALLEATDGVEIAAIYSTNFCRTAQTVQPLVIDRMLSLAVQPVNDEAGFNDCKPRIAIPIEILPARLNTEEAFVSYVLDQHAGETVVIAGHSNTVPALVNVLGNGAFHVADLDHEAYDDMFIVRVPGLWGSPSLTRARYGNSSK